MGDNLLATLRLVSARLADRTLIVLLMLLTAVPMEAATTVTLPETGAILWMDLRVDLVITNLTAIRSMVFASTIVLLMIIAVMIALPTANLTVVAA